MLALLAGLALVPAPAAQAPACADPSQCVQASAAQLFALADQMFASGNKAGAAELLRALTQDKHPELRAEARFRLAAVLEDMGDLEGATQSLRDLLAEQPGANRARLELARILGRMGKDREARAVLAEAERLGLPPAVEQNVRRFSATLARPNRRGLTLELTAGPDSNINQATNSQFVDTIIAPFQLDADARERAGFGYSGSAYAYSKDRIGPLDILSNAALHADFYDISRFNDVQLSLDSGPEFGLGNADGRIAGVFEKRWFGGRAYSTGFGGLVDATLRLSPATQLSLRTGLVRQTIDLNKAQDGWRTALNADVLQSLSSKTLARFSLRYGRLDARARPESLRQYGASLLVARQTQPVTVFGELDYTQTNGIEPQFLFGKTRHDHRWDLTGGVILNAIKLVGFSPIIRVTHSDSSANIALYQYWRTRFDFGVTRSF